MKIYKNFDPATSFAEATNADEFEEIARLKCPKACNTLSTGMGVFTRMVDEFVRHEGWKGYGFSSFEEFSREKLKPTLLEVSEKLIAVSRTNAEQILAEREAQNE